MLLKWKRKSPSNRARDKRRSKIRIPCKRFFRDSKAELDIPDYKCASCGNWQCRQLNSLFQTAYIDPITGEKTASQYCFSNQKISIEPGDVLTLGFQYTHPALKNLI